MSDITIQINEKFTGKSVYTITLSEQVTVLRDMSGTGKTALSNLVNTIEGSDYTCTLIGADYVLAVTSEKAAMDYSKDTEHSTVFIIDEAYVDKCFRVFEPLLNVANWHIVVITRDDVLMSTVDADYMCLITTPDNSIVNVPAENDAGYLAGRFHTKQY